MQVAFDMLRGALAMALGIAAFGFIVYLIVPGMGERSTDLAIQRISRARTHTAMFGGVGIITMVVFLTIGIMSAIRS